MLANQGAYLRFPFTFTASKLGKTGLASVPVNIYRNGSATPIATGTLTEWVGGAYYYDLVQGSVDANGEYLGVAITDDSSVDSKVSYSFYTVGKAGTPNLDATVSSRASAASLATLSTNLDAVAVAVSDLDDYVSDQFAEVLTDTDQIAELNQGYVSRTVAVSPVPSTTTFTATAGETTASFWVGSVVVFTAGALTGLARRVTGYSTAKLVTVSPALPVAPSAGDTFILTGRIDS